MSCGRNTTPPTPVLTGSWLGSGGGYVVKLTLTQSAQSVTGTGSIDGVGSTLPLTAHGTFNNPSFTLTISSQGFSDFAFAGSLDGKGNAMAGEMNGGGFNHVAITMNRQ